MSAPLVVVDGPFLLYRSFFALPDSIKGIDSRPVNALLGGANVLLRLIGDRDPRAIVVCFGAEAAAYRVELYPPYHAARPPVPDALQWQFDHAVEFFDAFGWSSAAVDAVEADDLLGSFASVEAAAGGRTLILTGDRDMYQCADARHDGRVPEDGRGRVRGRRPRRGGAALRDPAGARARLHRAARRSVGWAAGCARDRRQDGRRPARSATARSRRRSTGAIHERPRVTAALTEHADELRAFQEIATLRSVELERPPIARRISTAAPTRPSGSGCAGWPSGCAPPTASAICSSYFPFQTGARFSANAVAPSRASSEPITGADDLALALPELGVGPVDGLGQDPLRRRQRQRAVRRDLARPAASAVATASPGSASRLTSPSS